MSIKIKKRGKPIKEEELLFFEEYLGCKLPQDYRKFLKKHSGCIPEENIFEIPEDKNSSSINEFLNIQVIIQKKELFGNRLVSNVIPIAYDSCGNLICMSIGNDTGKIYFWDHELEEMDEDKLPSWKNMFLVADSFDDFMKKKLKKFDPNSIDYDSVQLEEVWLDPEFFEKIKRSALVPKKEDRSSSDSQEGYIELDDKAKKWFLENKNASKEQYEAFLMNNKHTSDKK